MNVSQYLFVCILSKMNTLATARTGKVTVSPAGIVDQNMPITFVKDIDRRIQAPLIDPGELYYNPSTKTLHCDRFSGDIPSFIEVADYAALPSTGAPLKIYVTTDTNKSYRWSGSAYFEISASLVLGTTSGTAFDGGSGQANTNAIALRQDQLTFGNLSGLTLSTDGTTKSLKIDMQKATSETPFDDDEFMLIQKTTGTNWLRRITKQQLQSSINTNTEYTGGTNITIDASNAVNLNDGVSSNSLQTRTNLV